MSKNKTKWLIGAVLFSGFLLTFFMDLTGLPIHQWLGFSVGVLLLYHTVTHLDWINSVAERFFGRTSNRSRVYLLINIMLACGFGLITGTGLLMSTWFALPLANYDFWRVAHILFSIGTLFLVATKLILHWRWIASAFRRASQKQPGPQFQSDMHQPAIGVARMGRRQFLGVMGTVGVTSLIAITSGLKSLGLVEETQTTVYGQDLNQPAPEVIEVTQVPQETVNPEPTQQAASPTTIPSTDTTCIVRCNRRCSYPGLCRRYIDANSNGFCDNGECL